MSTHARRLVKEYERGLSISWAPDGRSFFVNDASGSTDTLCYVYDPATLKETDLARLVVAAVPDAAQYLKAGHAYLEAKRWINSRELFVALSGHFDEQPPPGALGAFSFEYRVDLDGRVHEVSRHASEETEVSVAGPPIDRCAFPSSLSNEISRKYPGSRLVRLTDLQDDDRKFFIKGHGTRCPGLVRVNFYGDGKPTWALVLTPGENDPKRKVQLVVAHQTDIGWEIRPLESTDGSAPVIWSQPPGKYDDVYREKTIRAKWPVIVFCGYESWAVLYAWTGSGVKKVWLMD